MNLRHFISANNKTNLIITNIPLIWIGLLYLFMILFHVEHKKLPIPFSDDPKNESYTLLYLIISSGFFIALLSYFYIIIFTLLNIKNQDIKLVRKTNLIISILIFTIQLKYDPFSLILWFGD
jgi:ABC-type Na+ efflux pump permease subunit